MESGPSRSDVRRQAIVDAAADVFLRHGYLGATTDEVAKLAAVSKQTLYKHFADKEQLFASVIMVTSGVLLDRLLALIAATLDDTDDVRSALRELAGAFVQGLMQPEVLRLRRLVIAEADRFPDVARAWFDRGFEPTLTVLGEAFVRLAERGLLRELDDPKRAAYQFAGLVAYQPMNQAMFAGTDAVPSAAELDQIADSAVDVFLARYGALV